MHEVPRREHHATSERRGGMLRVSVGATCCEKTLNHLELSPEVLKPGCI